MHTNVKSHGQIYGVMWCKEGFDHAETQAQHKLLELGEKKLKFIRYREVVENVSDTEKSDLSEVWLDLTNAYGSMPHKDVDGSLKSYHRKWRESKVSIKTGSSYSLPIMKGRRSGNNSRKALS